MELANCPHPWFLLGWFFSWQKKCRLQHVVKNISARINTHWVADEDFGAAPFTKGCDCMRCVWTQNGRMTVIQRLSFKKDTHWNIIFLRIVRVVPFLQKFLAFCWHLWASPVWSPWPWMHCLPQSVMSQLRALRPVQLSWIQKLVQWPRTRSSACHHSEFVLFSTVCCAFQHSVLCFSAQCVVLFSTVCCAFQHSVLCFSAQCIALFSTMWSLSAQCQVQALFKAPRLGAAACPFSFLKNQDRNDLSISQ